MARGGTNNNSQPPTMEEMMAMINGLREENARSREREEVIQRENEEIRRRADEMQARIAANTRIVEEDVMLEVPRDFRPFSEAIEAEIIPRDHRIPQVEPFDGTQDPGQHLTDFRAQMLICGGSMEVRCKLFMGTLKKAALDWFSGLLDRSITDFDVFSRLFMAQFAANKRKPPITSDLFDLKQQREESLKDFMQRFNEVALRIASLDERMAVIAFQKGLRSGAFDIALEKANCQTMSEVWAFALSHIKTEENQIIKRAAENREASSSNKEGNKYLRPRSDWKATDRQLGPHKTDWCEFHRTHGHKTENCFVLGRQIERLIKEGRLKEFIAGKQGESSSDRRRRQEGEDTGRRRREGRSPPRDPPQKSVEAHQQAIHGDFNTIAGGFAGGGRLRRPGRDTLGQCSRLRSGRDLLGLISRSRMPTSRACPHTRMTR
ncbi:uncharacterized protein LOC109817053 [Cajanus cajan]|uniref:uncharacterized protein LOC109817053 n=1 Tax=Cajanus cajan TaxID=3821 RepID=UPI00098DAE57|nr:uncharacterized protein LOC109817053 [Cajanus cajan]